MGGWSFNDLEGMEKKDVVQERKKPSDLSHSEIAEMVFEMMISHRVMSCRIEKAENRLNILTSLMMKKGISIPL